MTFNNSLEKMDVYPIGTLFFYRIWKEGPIESYIIVGIVNKINLNYLVYSIQRQEYEFWNFSFLTKKIDNIISRMKQHDDSTDDLCEYIEEMILPKE